MAINFNKRKTQELCEKYISEEKSKLSANTKYKFDYFIISSVQKFNLKSTIKQDGIGFYYNALISFFQGLLSLTNNSVSWACVELYYSTYYSLRSLLAANDYAIIRHEGLYLLKIQENQHPIKKNSKEYNTDHKGTINYYIDCFENSDYMCSNKIDGDVFYKWMMDIRETTNYRNDHFKEPNKFDIIEEYADKIIGDKNTIGVLLNEFEMDWDIYCFLKETAWLAGPYRKLFETATKYKSLDVSLEDDQKEYIYKLLEHLNLSKYKNIFVI